MDREAIAREIRALLTYYLGLPLDEIGEDEPLGGSRINIGSLTAIEILTAIEDRFEVQLPDDMIDLTLFSSIGRLVDAVNAILVESQIHDDSRD
ncbi:MAG TPA: phosphopantetheine-binding protein [Pyrinomonadaceae bacterium]|nr:phosphopantetheine-binding protein [Pyrinomonadaceae bacterium]